MPELVPIPWQPTLYLTPRTLALLVAASNRLGRRIFLSGSDAAHRTYARQAYLYNGYIHHLPGFSVASSPDPPGQRSHMRGAAGDTLQYDGATQAAMKAVGFIRDFVEPWHQNDPNWANMPIIPTNTATAGGGSIPLPNPAPSIQEDDEMPRWYNTTDGKIWWGAYYVPNGDIIAVLTRYEAKGATAGAERDLFNPVQQVWIADALRANGLAAPAGFGDADAARIWAVDLASPSLTPTHGTATDWLISARLDAGKSAAGGVDIAALARSVSDAVIAALPAGSDAAAIAAAVETNLLDNFAAIPAAVITEQGKRLTNG